jgi:hypothetical protein
MMTPPYMSKLLELEEKKWYVIQNRIAPAPLEENVEVFEA